MRNEPLDDEQIFDLLKEVVTTKVGEVHGAVSDKIAAMEALSSALTKTAGELRVGDYDAKIFAECEEALERINDAMQATSKLVRTIQASRVQRLHPGTKGVVHLEDAVQALVKAEESVKEHGLYYKQFVPDIISRIAVLNPPPPEDLPF